jgi:hypothetical protein
MVMKTSNLRKQPYTAFSYLGQPRFKLTHRSPTLPRVFQVFPQVSSTNGVIILYNKPTLLYESHSADLTPINQEYYIPCLFQDIHNTSSAGWDFAPGSIGVSVLFKSHIRISDSEAPVANRFACNKYILHIYSHEIKLFLCQMLTDRNL